MGDATAGRLAARGTPVARPWMTVLREAKEAPLLVVALVGLFVLSFVMNLYVLPKNQVLSSLYAIPVLVAAHRLSPRAIGVAAGVAVLCYLVNARVEERPGIVWPFGVLALAGVGYLAVLFADQKEKAARRAQEVEDAHHRLQEFLALAGHDLAGALTAVMGSAELLSASANGGSRETALARSVIDGASQRMRRLIDDLRDAASIGTGHFALVSAPMSLGALVEQVVDEQRAAAGRRALHVDAPREIKGTWDEQRLSQLFTNLISNAIKYSPADGQIRVTVRQDSRRAVVSVADQGVGIPPDQQEFLFQPFYRGETRGAQGMGLGLYIAKAIADAHNSHIWIESTPGEGCTFFVSLPLNSDPDRCGDADPMPVGPFHG